MVIALFGMGTIGSGVAEIAAKLEDVQLKKILDKTCWQDNMTSNIEDILNDKEIELVVETMGGLHPAYEFACKVLNSGKHFVTANKYLVSVYGRELTELARKNGKAFLYGAACGGGIAYLANLTIARGLDHIEGLGGILNGTTNFILDAMQTRDMNYAEALKEAQTLGYAERDPASDVEGLDTMRKLILACAVGFDVWLDDKEIPTRGITGVLPADIAYFHKAGRVLRLCACAERSAEGSVSAYVEPMLCGTTSAESAIRKNINYAWYTGERYGLMSYTGQGAGKLPTAANVLRDVESIDAGRRYMTSEALTAAHTDNESAQHRYYVRLAKDTAFPAAWIELKHSDGQYDFIETAPISVECMHREMAKHSVSFFAGIQKG